MSSPQSSQDLDKLLFNLVRFEQQAPRFIEETTRRIVQEEILEPIKQKMKQKNYSQKIIDGTTIQNIFVDGAGFVQFDVISEYDTDESFDVATAREEGTRDHIIRPRKPNGVLRWVAKTGEILYRKFARVKGIRASHIIRDTVKSKFPTFQQRLTDEVVLFYQRTVN